MSVAFVLLAALLAEAAPPKGAAQITFVEGRAMRERDGSDTIELLQGAAITAGDVLVTAAGARLELTLPDRSVLRLGPSARLALTEAHFGGGVAKRRLSAKLFFGRLWAKVTRAVQGEQRFQIETENAVAGVRGTVFGVDARGDRSVRVRVYDGAVAVGSGASGAAEPGERHEVEGPQEVSREQWERIVGRQMEIVVGADGQPGEPARFSEDPSDAWSKWNRSRDAK